jgi:hypothetical protein
MKTNVHTKQKGQRLLPAAPLLGSKSYKLINRLQNNIAWLLLLPILCLQTPKSAGQSIKSLGIRENITHPLNLELEGGNLGSVSLLRCCANTEAPSGHCGIFNVGKPLLQKAKEGTPALPLIAATGDRQSDNGTSGTASKKADDKSNDGYVYWHFILLCTFFGAIGGALGSVITLALLTNVQSSGTRDQMT